jgi:hypothetical protein
MIARAILALLIGFALALGLRGVHARDDGTWKSSPLRDWFSHLSSQKGLCCSFADGVSVEDPDWGTRDNNYWVIINGKSYDIPPEAVVNDRNRYGKAVVWPMTDAVGNVTVRCFMAGVEG